MAKASESDYGNDGSTETLEITYRAQVIHSLGLAITIPGITSVSGGWSTIDTVFTQGQWVVSIAISCNCPGDEADDVSITY